MPETFAVAGAGLIGRAWAIVFARAGHSVRLWDGNPEALAASLPLLRANLDDLEAQGLIDSAANVAARVTAVDTLGDALDGARWMQECIAETVEAKEGLFEEADRYAEPDAILASSSSSITASKYTEALPGRLRCLVAHPVNPPYLVPLVELCPAPWTDPAVIQRARQVMDSVGMVPVAVNKEVEGFVLNRLQGALLAEAFKLVADGVISTDDLDKTVKDGLGLRWSFMGPFETIDLNAPGGIADYCGRYGPFYERLQAEQAEVRVWDADTVKRMESERRKLLGADDLGSRQVWRDRRLMALLKHKQAATDDFGG
ncbi:3-hydroxyacyl-CoA dehydrogenase [Thalassobaculum sp. OXR-137]|uniref:3-hydroxyacyl-CoA dehydrogenase n=1 Tax=Thalassobaculum sp. OXR-137 TaxID=3100173 RepID=UPI002AC9D9C3|nr:3-hydroxyacyl-CoA dehydrogenase [Thalassobaculum sp. OXR-137]WPZ33561.1 3-hydroxyacyl-CoA dehydrogenase [Thalassobaculum sp. OXR-137]